MVEPEICSKKQNPAYLSSPLHRGGGGECGGTTGSVYFLYILVSQLISPQQKELSQRNE